MQLALTEADTAELVLPLRVDAHRELARVWLDLDDPGAAAAALATVRSAAPSVTAEQRAELDRIEADVRKRLESPR